MKHTKCPACQSQNTIVATGEFVGASNQAFKNRICQDCGTAWRPATPRWLALIFIVVGVSLPLLQASIATGFSDLESAMGSVTQQSTNKGPGWSFIFVGGLAILYGLRCLFGRPGRSEILGKVDASKPASLAPQ